VSDDGAFAIVVIALLGNPFSPSYARARANGRPRALDHCALHVALHGPRRSLWALTERTVPDTARRPRALAIGSSRVSVDRDALIIDVDERATPIPDAVRGRIVVRPRSTSSTAVSLDAAGEHTWWPVAPLADVEVALTAPRVRFRGHGYHDANAGEGPIDAAFAGWTWSRARVGERVIVAYDVVRRDGSESAHGMVFDPRQAAPLDGLGDLGPRSRATLPATVWRLPRAVAADEGHAASIARSLTDSPFYARSLVRTRLLGRETTAMHEVLSADRLRSAWVRFLLGFRMARA
jgi:carotenoid 1,2-hydratase